MNIYIDSEFKCHTTNDGTRRAFDVSFFNNKCTEFIEGYRYIPNGETWERDGLTYRGELFTPWKPYEILTEIQTAVNRETATRDTVINAFEKVDATTAPAPKMGYFIRPVYFDGGCVWEYVPDPNYDGRGTYLKPIEFIDGMEVVKDYFYTDTENIWEAISTGYPESFNDPNFFDIITV